VNIGQEDANIGQEDVKILATGRSENNREEGGRVWSVALENIVQEDNRILNNKTEKYCVFYRILSKKTEKYWV
jgi:hypothetical protein